MIFSDDLTLGEHDNTTVAYCRDDGRLEPAYLHDETRKVALTLLEAVTLSPLEYCL